MPEVSWPLNKRHFLAVGVRLDKESTNPNYEPNDGSSWYSMGDDFNHFNYMIALLCILDIKPSEWIKDDVPATLLEAPFLQHLDDWNKKYKCTGTNMSVGNDSYPWYWISVRRFLDMGLLLDAQHPGTHEPYDKNSELFRIVDAMYKAIKGSGIPTLQWVADELNEDEAPNYRFLNRLETWDVDPGWHGIHWPANYRGPRTFAAAFLLAIYQVHQEETAHSQAVWNSNLGMTCLGEFIAEVEQHNLPQLVANYLTELQDYMADLGIPQTVVDSPGIFQIILTGAYTDPFNPPAYEQNFTPVGFQILAAVMAHYQPMGPLLEVPSLQNGVGPTDLAVFFAHDLPTVEISSIPRDDMRCPVCWANFDEVVDGYNNAPKRLPCCGKCIGKDCLIESISSNGTLCPHCRQNLM